MMHTPEFYEKAEIKKYLDKVGAWHFSPRMTGYGGNGVPDIVGCHRGKFFAVEVKRPNLKPTTIQWRRISEINTASGQCFWGTAEKVVAEFEAWIA